jgi:hypothetical protein
MTATHNAWDRSREPDQEDPHAAEKFLSDLCAVPAAVKSAAPGGGGGVAAGVAVGVGVNRSSTNGDQKLPGGGYPCEFCTKTFAKRDKLARHRNIHTGEKSYKCEFCSKAFGRSDKLYRHRKMHTEKVK